jgi:hypothetical protein
VALAYRAERLVGVIPAEDRPAPFTRHVARNSLSGLHARRGVSSRLRRDAAHRIHRGPRQSPESSAEQDGNPAAACRATGTWPGLAVQESPSPHMADAGRMVDSKAAAHRASARTPGHPS